MASLKDKIGYGFGDMASSMFWKIFSYYLPFFYAHIFGIGLAHAAVLFLVTRIWDAVSDPMMGIIADRTQTRWGKYRPYVLWFAIPFAVCGILLFSTPDFSQTGKLVWAYVTYIMMMTVYTGINVPYGAMLGVITPDSAEKTVFSSYRMFFAYGGSFIALAAWEPLCNLFQNSFGMSAAGGWQWAMIVIAVACALLFFLCFKMTREQVKSKSEVSVGSDLSKLLRNGPWWLLIGAALSTNLFNTVRGSTVAFYFADLVSPDATLALFGLSFAFFAGLFLAIGELFNMVGVMITVPIVGALGKKNAFMAINILLAVLSVAFFYIPLGTTGGYWMMLVFQILISIGTGIVSPLVWSMYADVSDYSEQKYHTASTGLIFSSASMAQKFGSAFGGSGALWLLAAFGYVTYELDSGVHVTQSAAALDGLRYLMSYIPAAVALFGAFMLIFYPLTTSRMEEIDRDLRKRRGGELSSGAESAEVAGKDASTEFCAAGKA